MSFKRHLYSSLLVWKDQLDRKPLLLRGARQVGKTTLVREFAKEYDHFIELNLERNSDAQFFKDFDDIPTLVDALFLSRNTPSDAKQNTLVFIDEIQEFPKAIGALRYFFEDIPDLHVIAAGSLLEHAMQKVQSVPVGRVQYAYLHPLNFVEFLEAKQQPLALEQLQDIPISSFAQPVLKKLFHEYAIIGGMPEIIKAFLIRESVADLVPYYESLWSSYKDDVEKYARNSSDARVIRHIMSTAHMFLDERIKLQNFGNSNYKSREVGESFRNLNDARVIQLIYPTTDLTPPITVDLKKSPRLQFLDTGLVNFELNIQANMLALEDLNNSYKGGIVPHLIIQELISLETTNYRRPNFWVRQKAQSSAEVDIVLPFKDKLIPIEVKSGKTGTLKSLHQFVDRSPHHFAIRMYAGKFSVVKQTTPIGKKSYTLMNLPYYLGTQLPAYIKYFLNDTTLD